MAATRPEITKSEEPTARRVRDCGFLVKVRGLATWWRNTGVVALDGSGETPSLCAWNAQLAGIDDLVMPVLTDGGWVDVCRGLPWAKGRAT